jgi:hypothetical protein
MKPSAPRYPYPGDIVAVGGWVPSLPIPQEKSRHIGGMNFDMAMTLKIPQDPGYKTIQSLRIGRGYRQDEKQPFIFWRTVTTDNRPTEIEVDLLLGEYGGSTVKHRAQKVQDISARKARGCELAFRFAVAGAIHPPHQYQ